ncbi:MAG: twin-arginine translocase subunit TatC [Oscillospiraceae bacterium]|nr:twin-arginine translocase subunit TatC [Oscillospiraceae bacterium]
MAAKTKTEGQNGSMPLTGHLKELRNRILICVIPFAVLTAVFIPIADKFLKVLTDMGTDYGYQYVYLSPQELLIEYLRIAVLGAIICCVPIILFQIWSFAQPGLEKGEKRMFGFSMLFGLLCFCLGILFAYKITLPFMLNFLIGLSNSTVSAAISIEKYTSFLLTVFMIFGIIFEMPLLSVVLTNLGLIQPDLLKKVRKPAIVVSFILAALITPPDIFSQVMVALPIILLYQVSIWLSSAFYHLRKKKEESN